MSGIQENLKKCADNTKEKEQCLWEKKKGTLEDTDCQHSSQLFKKYI